MGGRAAIKEPRFARNAHKKSFVTQAVNLGVTLGEVQSDTSLPCEILIKGQAGLDLRILGQGRRLVHGVFGERHVGVAAHSNPETSYAQLPRMA